MASDNIIELTAENFENEIQGDRPLLVDFWAAWCGPCRMVAPVLDELAEELGDQVKIGKLNVDEHQELSMRFQVSSIPTFLLFKDGEVADRMMGAMPKAAFQKFIEKNAGPAVAKPAAV